MKEIEIQVHLAGQGQPKAIKIAEDATIGQLLELAQAAGAAIALPGLIHEVSAKAQGGFRFRSR